MDALKAKKSLGQYFLKDEHILDEIVRVAEVGKEDWVFEVGPGMGALTERLLRVAGQVLAIELDHRMVEHLEQECAASDNLCILEGNILEMNLAETLAARGFAEHGYNVVANIPYYITAPIIKLFLSLPSAPRTMVLLVQEAVADRLAAKPGQMSLLSVMAQYYTTVTKEFLVPREAFDPVPAVSSAVVRFAAKRPYDAERDRALFRLARAGFAARRKTLVNNLSASFSLSHAAVEGKLAILGLRKDIRAQALAIADWDRLREIW